MRRSRTRKWFPSLLEQVSIDVVHARVRVRGCYTRGNIRDGVDLVICTCAAHSVALTDEGTIFTWGNGGQGRLGHGSSSNEILPREVKLSAHSTVRAVAVAAGECHSCVLRSISCITLLLHWCHENAVL